MEPFSRIEFHRYGASVYDERGRLVDGLSRVEVRRRERKEELSFLLGLIVLFAAIAVSARLDYLDHHRDPEPEPLVIVEGLAR